MAHELPIFPINYRIFEINSYFWIGQESLLNLRLRILCCEVTEKKVKIPNFYPEITFLKTFNANGRQKERNRKRKTNNNFDYRLPNANTTHTEKNSKIVYENENITFTSSVRDLE